MANIYEALKPVESSLFSRAGYDDATWQLLFEFKTTQEVRAYQGVSPEVADEALGAPSIGKYWNANIKGNAGWPFETLGADPTTYVAPTPVAQPEPLPDNDLGITDEDIRAVDPTYVGEQEQPAPQGEIVSSTDLATSPQAQIMSPWRAPESATEALEMLSDRETEIDAIIAQNRQRGQDALTIVVKDAETRLAAGDRLTELTEIKDRTTEQLDPLREMLYQAYTYAAGKKKAALDPVEDAIKTIKNRALQWDGEQKRLKAEADRQAREAADVEARRRQQEEQQRLTLAEVQDHLDEGNTEIAESLFSQPIEVPKPYVAPVYQPSSAPVIEGQSTSTKYKVDENPLETEEGYLGSVMTLLRAVKEDKIELRLAATYLRWNLVDLQKLAGALKTAFFVPGLSVKPVDSMSVGRKK